MATVSSLRNRLLLFQAEYRDAVIGVVFFCALPLAALIPIAMNQDNPVVATQRVMGTIEYVRLMPNPKMAAGRGLYYTYDVRLDGNNAVTSIDDEVGMPHLVGSVIPIERQHHKRGGDTYRFLNE
ncbi:hypothetical protein LB559_25535 [Mesorhizobium sp. BR1-1-3]|uniref:hypothetical protein n=1 Tax=Mesorhizobium sp. BR1-1-3 TaxID=2876651 RepID=UPI001CD13BF7|nr:hypothetical protein [Mesorhizobium sp. BR1-1-3]MBZ9891296.1 hypothetical protein [Mesorhizobium sp. BR1-1-3]